MQVNTEIHKYGQQQCELKSTRKAYVLLETIAEKNSSFLSTLLTS